jgi:hypothetical protein
MWATGCIWCISSEGLRVLVRIAEDELLDGGSRGQAVCEFELFTAGILRILLHGIRGDF